MEKDSTFRARKVHTLHRETLHKRKKATLGRCAALRAHVRAVFPRTAHTQRQLARGGCVPTWGGPE